MDILFMCVDKETLVELCDLFPQTAENIKKRSLERRTKFMQQRNLNSESYQRKMEKKKDEAVSVSQSGDDVAAFDDKQIPFMSDEEPENFESQKEDMKMYLNKLNKKVETLVDALKTADQMMAKMGDQKALLEQIKNKQTKAQGDNKKFIADVFKESINKRA